MKPESIDEDSNGRLADALGRLKTTGCSLLVVGDVPLSLHRRACRQLLGAENGGRRRLIANVDDFGCSPSDLQSFEQHVADRLRILHQPLVTSRAPSTADRTSVGADRPISADDSTSTPIDRIHSASEPPTPPRTGVDVHLTDDGIDTLGIAISREIAGFEVLSGGPEPGEIRLCVSSARPLVDRHGRERVFRFLHLLGQRLRTVRGMGHTHYPEPIDSDTTRIFETVTDATVELGIEDATPVHRWHLRYPALTTDWMAL